VDVEKHGRHGEQVVEARHHRHQASSHPAFAMEGAFAQNDIAHRGRQLRQPITKPSLQHRGLDHDGDRAFGRGAAASHHLALLLINKRQVEPADLHAVLTDLVGAAALGEQPDADGDAVFADPGVDLRSLGVRGRAEREHDQFAAGVDEEVGGDGAANLGGLDGSVPMDDLHADFPELRAERLVLRGVAYRIEMAVHSDFWWNPEVYRRRRIAGARSSACCCHRPPLDAQF
jgi:hypothetical protein